MPDRADCCGVQPPDVSYAQRRGRHRLPGRGRWPRRHRLRPRHHRRSALHLGAAAAHPPRRGLAACGRVLMLDKRGTGLSDRVREVQSLEDDDGRRTGGDGRGRIGARRALDRSDEHRHRRALRGDLSRAVCGPRPLRPAGKGFARPTIRGPRPRRSGAGVSWACAPGGESAATSRASPVSGLRRSPRTTASATGSSGTCAAASARAALTSFRTAMELDVRDVSRARTDARHPAARAPRPRALHG